MALLVSTLLNTKNGFVPLPNKLDDGNYYTWKKSVILTLRTLKLQDHFSSDKIPPQFETVPSPQADSGSVNKASGVESDPNAVAKKTHTSTSQILQESEKYTEWMQNDCALMTWLDASMSLSYQNRVVHCATFAEAWDTLTHIHSSSSATRIQSLKDQLRATKKTGTMIEYFQCIRKLVDSLHSIGHPFSDTDHIQAIIDGLLDEYEVYVASILSRLTTFTIPEA
ncbi:Homeobox protein HD-1, variant 2 [Stylosanthes scabra]|uniref:Homeobox protein HD-1, variant 2 n=1 Tax=Stylosanthes scabra TaxID=79078 RepID=A0ABU6YM23_9FABA|nr:Homeobox protein HD-1, variant 2 [Stylosanthes scabra]